MQVFWYFKIAFCRSFGVLKNLGTFCSNFMAALIAWQSANIYWSTFYDSIIGLFGIQITNIVDLKIITKILITCFVRLERGSDISPRMLDPAPGAESVLDARISKFFWKWKPISWVSFVSCWHYWELHSYIDKKK